MTRLSSVWILGVFACASHAPNMVEAPMELRGGINPSDAVDESLASFQAQGFVLDVREDADAFAAFGAQHPDGRTVVRVASERGWVLAVTAPSESHSRPWVRLQPGAHDTDGNGRAELLIAAPDVVRGVVCASIVEIADGGAVERHVDFAAYGGQGCILGRAPNDASQLIARVFYPSLSRGVVPQVRLTLGRGLRVVEAAQITSDQADPDEASGALRWARAVAAAAVALVRGEDTDEQVRAFEAQVDCTALAAECDALRAHIGRGWNRAED